MTVQRIVSCLAAGCIAFASSQQTNADSISVQTFGPGSKYVNHSNKKLSTKHRNILRNVRARSGYFAAVAFHGGGDVFFHVDDMHDLEMARLFALRGCEIIAAQERKNPDLCHLHGSIIPRSLSRSTKKASGLGESGLMALKGKYANQQKPGKFGAFAISGMSNWGWTSGSSSEAEARGSAVARCEASSKSFIASWSNETRRRIAEQQLDQCRVVHVSSP